ncbi:MAG: DNA alkylation repair protein [Thermodesulfovibrionales bacterium]
MGVPKKELRRVPSDMKWELASFRKALRAAHDPERARDEKRYLKSPLKFFGVAVPFIEGMAKDFKKANGDKDRRFVFEIAERLWASDYHQEKTLAIRLLGQYGEHLDYRAMPLLERMLSESTGWDHVDGISTRLVDAVLRKEPKAYGYLKRWGRSGNFWMRRASLVSQVRLLRQGRGDRELFFQNAGAMMGDKEFFVRKAIGWALREMSKADPQGVFAFLMKARDEASALTLREGSKRLQEAQKRLVLQK